MRRSQLRCVQRLLSVVLEFKCKQDSRCLGVLVFGLLLLLIYFLN